MKVLFICLLMLTYAACALYRVGGHYIHVLPVMAMMIYIYGLFNAKSAGIGSE